MADRYLCHPLGDFVQTSGYDCYTYIDNEGPWHHQCGKLDLPCPTGTAIYSMTDGEVVGRWTDSNGVTGLEIKANNFGITLATEKEVIIRYLHWSECLVGIGDTVKAGQKIAISGEEGSPRSPHLHIDMKWHLGPVGDSSAVRMRPYSSSITPYYDFEARANDTIKLYQSNDRLPIDDYLIYHIFTQNIVKVTQDVPEDSHAAVIWNWFINANIPNVSNRPELIAGIIGNFQQETGSGIDVLEWCNHEGTDYYGPWCESNPNFRQYMINAGFTFHPFTNNPSNQSDAIPYTLEWLTQHSDSWVNWLSRVIDQVSSQTGEAGARAYAELFAVCVEKCVNGEYAVNDPGVRQIMLNYYGGREYLYQHLENRRNNAAAIYNKFAK